MESVNLKNYVSLWLCNIKKMTIIIKIKEQQGAVKPVGNNSTIWEQYMYLGTTISWEADTNAKPKNLVHSMVNSEVSKMM